MRGRRDARQRGFTLIEVMIVVAVIALLAAVALPSFQDSIRKSRRTDARNALTTVAQLLERYNTQKNTYAGATLGASGLYPNKSESGYYSLTLSNLAATTFTITAAPSGGQSADSCGSFTLDQTGQRTPATSGCW